MAKSNANVSTVRRSKHGWILTLLFSLLSILWVFPMFVVLVKSFKRKAYIFRVPFGFSTVSITEGWDAFKDGAKLLFNGWLNYQNGIRMTNFVKSFEYSLFITVCSVAVIILFCSMCAWYIVRVRSNFSKVMYTF